MSRRIDSASGRRRRTAPRGRPRFPGTVVLAAGVTVALAALAGCQRSPGPGGGPSGDAAPATTAARTATASATSPALACSRIVSAVGWVDMMLVPGGAEDRQRFDDALRGRIAYVVGVIGEVGTDVPGPVRADVDRLRRAADLLTPAENGHDDQVRELREFRAAAADVADGCSAG